MILSQIEREMLRQKDRDHQWDDQIDVSRFIIYLARCFPNILSCRIYINLLPCPTINVSLSIYHHPSPYHRRRRTRMRRKNGLRALFAYVAHAVVAGS